MSDDSVAGVWRTDVMGSWYITFKIKDMALKAGDLGNRQIGNTQNRPYVYAISTH